MKKNSIIYISLFFAFVFSGCMEKKTENAIETYKLWSGSNPPKEIEVIHGKYWQSSHWSKEYVMYLELKAPPNWINEFISQNHLNKTDKLETISDDAPIWFKPGKESKIFIPKEFTEGSTYYYDSLKGHFFIYEIQL